MDANVATASFAEQVCENHYVQKAQDVREHGARTADVFYHSAVQLGTTA